MKKITLLFLALLTTSLGFSQSLPLDFTDVNDQTFTTFNGTSVSYTTDPGDGSNDVMEIVGGTNQWDGISIGLDTYIDLSNDSNNTISFRMYLPLDGSSSHSHLLKLEGGSSGATQLFFTTSGTGWQNVSVDFGPGLGTEYPTLTLFTDCNDGSDNTTSATYLIDDIDGTNGAVIPTSMPPATAAPTPPARDANDVISLYSDAYTDTPSNFDAGWCGASSVSEIMVAGNATQAYLGNACQGIVLNTGIDASTFTNLHVDVYIEAGTDVTSSVFNLKFVQQPGGAALEINLNAASTPPLTAGSWLSLDIPVDLSTFDGFKEFGITSNLNNKVWYDNLYVHKNTTLSADRFDLLNVSAYPNPSSTEWKISVPNNTIKTVEVFNLLGKRVVSQNFNSDVANVSVESLASGIYLAKITTELGTKTIKLIRE